MNKFYKYIIGLLLASALTFSFGFSTFAQQTPKVDFFDVSHWNNSRGIPLSIYQTLKRSGINSVVIKLSDGLTYIDPAASVNFANAKQSNMYVSIYHYARFTSVNEAKNEAIMLNKKLQVINFDKKKDGYVVLDIEENNLTNVKFDLTMYCNIFISTMKSYGYKVDIYSGSSYYNSRLIPNMLVVDNPWLAKYSSSYALPNFTKGKGAWQFSQNFRFTGISGSFDVSTDFYGKYTNIQSVPNSSTTVGKIGVVSLINYMKSKNMDSSYANRTKLAKAYGIEGYTGSASQNLALLSKLKSGVKPAKVDTSKLTTVTPPPVQPVKIVDTETKVDPKIQPKVQPKTTTQTVTKIYTYKVKSGDSLWKIAKSKNTTVNTLISLNKFKNPNALKVGQVIKYPTTVKVTVVVKDVTKVTPPNKKVYYIVKSGDSVSKIASVYHISTSQIKLLNKLDSKCTIYVGERLIIK